MAVQSDRSALPILLQQRIFDGNNLSLSCMCYVWQTSCTLALVVWCLSKHPSAMRERMIDRAHLERDAQQHPTPTTTTPTPPPPQSQPPPPHTHHRTTPSQTPTHHTPLHHTHPPAPPPNPHPTQPHMQPIWPFWSGPPCVKSRRRLVMSRCSKSLALACCIFAFGSFGVKPHITEQ